MNNTLGTSETLDKNLRFIKKLIPRSLFLALQPRYHYLLAVCAKWRFGNPSKKLRIVAVTGTKGKSTTTELINAMLEAGGAKTALLNTIRFKIGSESTPNLFKMTVPGRFFLQRFLRQALDQGATNVVLEMSSEAAKLFRHAGIEFDALIFLNLAPEHLEAHGSMEAYAAAKLSLAAHLAHSHKRPRIVVANGKDHYGPEFLKVPVETKLPFSLEDGAPYTADENGARFFWRGELFTSPLPGEFNLQNTLAAMTLCEAIGVPPEVMQRGINSTAKVPGRAERIEHGQPFTVIVDYAHTPDSLRALYKTFSRRKALRPSDDATARKSQCLCVMGATGGGRDKWKRGAMGKVADQFCDSVFLTDEDPYDEDPESIIEGVAGGFSRVRPHIVIDRRLAIRSALQEAREGDVVLITGKGTDPYIMRAGGKKEPWSDKKVAEEELDRLAAREKKKTAVS